MKEEVETPQRTCQSSRQCSSEGCENEAGTLRCPTCIKLELPDAFFCSQACFKSNWALHKLVHTHLSEEDNKQGGQTGISKNNSALLHGTVNVYNPWPSYHFSGPLRPFRQSARREVPAQIVRPDYALHPDGVSLSERSVRHSTEVVVNNEEEQEGVRLASRLGREVLDEAARAIEVGVTTDEIDRVVHEACIERDCYPSPLGYYRFPKSCCTSVNEVICHGIPDTRPLANGDLCNVDITVYHGGFHGDLNETFFVGDAVSEENRRLVQVTHECLQQAIDIVRPGVKFREIGNVIQKHAAANGYSVVKRYCGHGIHRLFHTAPNVPHYAKNKAVGVMKAGNTFTIEPMINAGTYHDEQWPDNWTAVTSDGKPSAQFEHTLLVTPTGVEVLTQRRSGNGQPWFMEQLANSYTNKTATNSSTN